MCDLRSPPLESLGSGRQKRRMLQSGSTERQPSQCLASKSLSDRMTDPTLLRSARSYQLHRPNSSGSSTNQPVPTLWCFPLPAPLNVSHLLPVISPPARPPALPHMYKYPVVTRAGVGRFTILLLRVFIARSSLIHDDMPELRRPRARSTSVVPSSPPCANLRIL